VIAFEDFLDDRPVAGAFRVHGSVFSDPDLFEAEMRYLFEQGWVFLGLESQVPEPHDFLTAMAGRKPGPSSPLASISCRSRRSAAIAASCSAA
jgi:hypothetical protein